MRDAPRFAGLVRSLQKRGAAVARTARSLFAEAVWWRIAVHHASRCVFRNPTGLRHLATSKWGTLREAIRRTDRPQKHSIADEQTLFGLPPIPTHIDTLSAVSIASPPVLSRNATPPVLHQRHFGRVLRSSSNPCGRRLASSRGRESRTGRHPTLWPGDLRVG